MRNNSNSEVEFRKIPSLKFLYEVSEDGRIVRNVKSKHHLKQDQDWGGYYRVSPFIDGRQIHRFVHVLVAECWYGPKPEGFECDHIDNDRHNNHYTNLRYVTKQENLSRRVFTEEGKRRNGEITSKRYFSSTPERQKEIIAPMFAAHTPETEEKRIKAVLASVAHPVTITKDGKSMHFESKAKCSHYIAEQEGCSVSAIEYYMHQRRKNIHGYDITYEK